MVDTFLFLTLARTGDQLQGMKSGILELADVIAVNKADGEHAPDSPAGGPGAVRRAADAARRRGRLAGAGGHLHGAARRGPGRRVAARASGTATAGRPRRAGGASAAASWSTGPARWSGTGCCPGSTRSRTSSPRPRPRVLAGELTPDQAAAKILTALD